MPTRRQPAQELALDKHTAHANDLVGLLVDDDDIVVGARAGAERVELLHPGVFARVGDDGENAENVEVAAAVVR